jgi:hypothetical protein
MCPSPYIAIIIIVPVTAFLTWFITSSVLKYKSKSKLEINIGPITNKKEK